MNSAYLDGLIDIIKLIFPIIGSICGFFFLKYFNTLQENDKELKTQLKEILNKLSEMDKKFEIHEYRLNEIENSKSNKTVKRIKK